MTRTISRAFEYEFYYRIAPGIGIVSTAEFRDREHVMISPFLPQRNFHQVVEYTAIMLDREATYPLERHTFDLRRARIKTFINLFRKLWSESGPACWQAHEELESDLAVLKNALSWWPRPRTNPTVGCRIW